MKKTTISVQELLDAQANEGLRATIEAVENQKDRVKVTPYLPGHGCQCAISLVVPKDSIASLAVTGETHQCCGKTRQVVEVQFKKGAGISPDAVLSQLVANHSRGGHRHAEMAEPEDFRLIHPVNFPNPSNGLCKMRYQNCLANASDDFDECVCRNAYCLCSGNCRLSKCPPPYSPF